MLVKILLGPISYGDHDKCVIQSDPPGMIHLTTTDFFSCIFLENAARIHLD